MSAVKAPTPGESDAYQVDYLRGSVVIPPGRAQGRRRPSVRRRQAGDSHRRVREVAQHQAVRPHDRLGLVLLHHQAAVQTHGVDQLVGRQLRHHHSDPDHHREGRLLPARQQAVREHGAHEEDAARDGAHQGAATRTMRSASRRKCSISTSARRSTRWPAAGRSCCRSRCSLRCTRYYS